MNTDGRAVLFLHGGPGLNSVAEESLLGPLLEKRGLQRVFWNEPSKLRPTGDAFSAERAFENWVSSAKSALLTLADSSGPVTLAAHSFATQAAVRLLPECPQAISRLVLITPALKLHGTFKRIMGLALQDFTTSDPVKAATLKAKLETTRKFMDPAMLAGLELAAQDPLLLSHYWFNPSNMGRFFQAWADQGAGLDLESLFAVCSDLAKLGGDSVKFPKASLPVEIIFGKHDVLTQQDEQLPDLRATFSNLKVSVFDQAGHFPHIEKALPFIDLLCDS